MRMQETEAEDSLLYEFCTISLHLLRLLDLFPRQIPRVLIEVDVVMVPFEFAALEIDIV